MQWPLHRRGLIALGVTVLVAVGLVIFSIALGPAVRSRIAAEAAVRRLSVHVGSVGLGWFSVRLQNVEVSPAGTSAIRAHLDEVRVVLGPGLHVSRVELLGGELVLRGSAASIRDAWQAWRARVPSTGESARTTPLSLDLSAISLQWADDGDQQPKVELAGIAGTRDDRGTRLIVHHGRARLGSGAMLFFDAAIALDPSGLLTRAHAGSLVAEWSAPAPFSPTAVDLRPPDPTPAPPAPASPRSLNRAASSPPRDDPSPPLVALPDLHSLRSKTQALVRLLAQRIGEDADVGVDALVLKMSQHAESVPLTFGPGPFAIVHSRARIEIRYATDSHSTGAPLALMGHFPIDADDSKLTIEGGPVALPILGIQEGAAGLVDVARATVAGRVLVVLAADASALTFDGEGSGRGLSLNQPTLASEVVRGLDVALRARGALTNTDIRLDDFSAKLGAFQIVAGGNFTQTRDHVAAAGWFEIPTATCESILTSFPTALLPALQGTTMTGTLMARGDFAFDTQALADFRLEYDVQDRCRVVRVPPALARERFEQQFSHRIYLPDGTTADETTGPGTPNWTPLDQISPFMEVAVLTTEDGAFPHHHGFNHAAIRAAIVANIKARRFARGASTITMQLAKNLFLSRDKTLSRKLEEVILTDYLEQTFSKEELMELYLNVIEFGPGVYGITSAADYFFGRTPAELNFVECLFLSSILPAPLRYASMHELEQPPEGWMHGLRRLMLIAHKNGHITDAELADAESEPVVFWHGGARPAPRPSVRHHFPVDGEDTDYSPPPFEPDAP